MSTLIKCIAVSLIKRELGYADAARTRGLQFDLTEYAEKFSVLTPYIAPETLWRNQSDKAGNLYGGQHVLKGLNSPNLEQRRGMTNGVSLLVDLVNSGKWFDNADDKELALFIAASTKSYNACIKERGHIWKGAVLFLATMQREVSFNKDGLLKTSGKVPDGVAFSDLSNFVCDGKQRRMADVEVNAAKVQGVSRSTFTSARPSTEAVDALLVKLGVIGKKQESNTISTADTLATEIASLISKHGSAAQASRKDGKAWKALKNKAESSGLLWKDLVEQAKQSA